MDEDEILNARQVAEQNPELDATRRQLFGENYLQDIDQGTGIAQYYTGFGQMPTLDYTPPVVEEAAPAVDVTQPVIDTDGGGGGIDISTGNETGNTAEQQRLLDAGIGVQAEPGAFISAPGEGMLTQQAIDELADYPLNTSYGVGGADGMSGGQATPGAEFADQNPYGGTGTMDDLGADSFPEYQEPTVANLASTAPGITDYLEGIDPATGLTETIDTRATEPPSLGFGTPPEADIYQDPIMGMVNMNQADVIASDANVGFDTPEQTNAINEAFNSVKDLGEAGVDKLRDSLVALGGKVKEGFDNTIEIGGKTIDLGKSLVGGAISLVSGVPGVGFLLNAVQEDPVDTYNQSLFSADDYLNSDMYKADKDMTDQEYSEYKNRLGGYYGDLRAGNIEGQDPFGKNITSAFGDYEAMAQDIVDKVSSIPVNERTQFQKDQLDFYGDVVKDTPAPQEDIGATDTMASINMQEAKDITDRLSNEITDGSDLRGDPYGGGQTGVQSGMNTPTNDFAGQGTGGDGPAGGASNAAANEAAASNREAARSGQYDSGGGGGGGGGGKIVCTMMNNSYGFGSFRNKIWLKHSKHLAPEYQIGYHKIFLPLVKLSKTNKVVKKVLEHIAVHRTIDIRQEARGKVHLLGRVYRKILEPICYVVGKYVK
jgi:hypothetical protein